jgi:hypothetical protein
LTADRRKLIFTLLVLEFIILFWLLRYVLNTPLSFFVASDDGYYNGGIVKGFGPFNLGPGWMNYAAIIWYRFLPAFLHPWIAVFYRFAFYLITFFTVRKLYATTDEDKLLAGIVFLFPLLFYYVFKPASEVFMMPLLAIVIWQLSYDKLRKWREIALFCLCFFIIMQFKPILLTLAAFACLRFLMDRRLAMAGLMIALMLGGLASYKALSYDFSKEKSRRPLLSIVVFNSLRQKQIFTDMMQGKVDAANPDYRAAIVREGTLQEMVKVVEETGGTELGIARYLLQNPDLIFYQIAMNFIMIFGGVGRMWLVAALFIFNLAVFILTWLLLRRGNTDHRSVFYHCLAYLAIFLLILPNFRYTYTVLPIIYFLCLSGLYQYCTQKRPA